jgi:hypothetical protein
MVSELGATESLWSQGGNADRNKRLLKRWKNDIKVREFKRNFYRNSI